MLLTAGVQKCGAEARIPVAAAAGPWSLEPAPKAFCAWVKDTGIHFRDGQGHHHTEDALRAEGSEVHRPAGEVLL